MRFRLFTVSALAVLALIAAQLFGQEWAASDRLSLPTDWSFSHVIYSRGFPAALAGKMKNDPRLYHSWALQGHLPAATAASSRTDRGGRGQAPQPHRDWSFSLGSGTVAQNMSPAKFNFNINETVSASSCTGASADFVVYGLNVAGTTAATDAKASGVFTSEPGSGSVLTITVNGTAFPFTANSSSNSSNSYKRSSSVSTDASNLVAAIALNSSLNTLVSAVANSPTTGEVALTAKTTGGTITIAGTSGSPNFGSITWTSGAAQSNLVALQNLYSAPAGGSMRHGAFGKVGIQRHLADEWRSHHFPGPVVGWHQSGLRRE